jgi:hypothetical protein
LYRDDDDDADADADADDELWFRLKSSRDLPEK